MADDRFHGTIDTVSKLLIPIVIFVVGSIFSFLNYRNAQFDRETGILRLAASSNEKERDIGMKIIENLQKQGKFSAEMKPVVEAISQGRPGDPSTQTAQRILDSDKRGSTPVGQQPAVPPKSQIPIVYLQIAKEEQRAEAGELQASLHDIGLEVAGIELVSGGTINTYIRYFANIDKPYADKVLEQMKKMQFEVREQDFTKFNQGKESPGGIEVWIGQKHVPPSKQ